MCLTISVELTKMTKHDAESLAAAQRASSKLELHYEGTTEVFGRGNSRFSIFEVGEGCACSMLTDNADWNAVTWEFQPTLLSDLASTLAFISERAPNGFAVEAVWIGESPGKIWKCRTMTCLKLFEEILLRRKLDISSVPHTRHNKPLAAASP